MHTRTRSQRGVVVAAAAEPEEIAGAANSDAGHHVLPVAVAPRETHHRRR